ncbi:hypothetical protein E3U55_04440 [Filobacillus milosensis]|uniref:Lipoprotein n=1 Tax=Filobacillus milosensis TaxID=94137 RepID=A0A4Y8IR86_9BACI|nr:hypothetical protein [Filobacillus milosensis]TFB24066.1 hypothetical protein E3U55_04440 [Filobacillus milosensis]
MFKKYPFLILLVSILLVACNNQTVDKALNSELLNGVKESIKSEHKVETLYANDNTPLVKVNKEKCNDVTGKDIPIHLKDICKIYDEIKPLTRQEKEMLYQETAALAVRYTFHSEENIDGEIGEYGAYLLHNYLSWRINAKPNAQGKTKSLKRIQDFDKFFKITEERILIDYKNNQSLGDAIEYDIQVVSRMKDLNLETSFNDWANETKQVFREALNLYENGAEKEAYIRYVKGLKRIYDMYVTIPSHPVTNRIGG